jgi:multidrug resistance efflux pump
VRAGQALALLDHRRFEARVAQAEAEARIDRAHIGLTAAERELSRTDGFWRFPCAG